VSIEKKLEELGFSLPDAPKPVAAYVPALISGNNLWVSGQLPMRGGELIATGKAVIEDPDFKKAVLKAKLPWNLIKYGTPEDCAAYAKDIMAVGRDFASLMSSKK